MLRIGIGLEDRTKGSASGPSASPTVPPVALGPYFLSTRGSKTGHSGTTGKPLAFSSRALEEAKMPVFIMWAVPAVLVIGGASYYLLRAVH
jgi:hypothetical protein